MNAWRAAVLGPARPAPGMGVEGAACVDGVECGATLGCVADAAGVFACRRYCDLAQPMCLSGTTCTAFERPAVFGSAEYGVCI